MDKKEIIRVAGIYVMLNVGAGFTSGQEVIQFFSGYGWAGFLTGAIVFLLLLYSGESMIDAGWLCRNNQRISVFEYFGGKYIGNFYNIMIPILSFGSYVIMIAGAGSILEQAFGVHSIVGRLIVSVLSVVSLFLKFQYVAKYLNFITRGILFIIVILSGIVILKGLGNISKVSQFVQNFPIKTAGDTFYGAGMLYSGGIVLGTSQFLFDTGMGLNDRKSGFYGILFGAGAFVGAVLITHLAILLFYDQVSHLPIITLFFAEQVSPILALFLTIMIFVAMYAASTLSLWAVSDIVKKKFNFWKIQYVAIIVSLGVGGLLGSAFSFESLVNFIYPIRGIFGLCVLLLIAYHSRVLVYNATDNEEASDLSIDSLVEEGIFTSNEEDLDTSDEDISVDEAPTVDDGSTTDSSESTEEDENPPVEEAPIIFDEFVMDSDSVEDVELSELSELISNYTENSEETAEPKDEDENPSDENSPDEENPKDKE